MSTDKVPVRRQWRWVACGIILVGTILRAQPLTVNRYHADEALFYTLSRFIVNGADPLLSQTSLLVDKPPLAYYFLALTIALGGSHEIVVRMPSYLASILTLALVARVSFTCWRSYKAAFFGLFLAALSPFAISFAPTAFSDSILVAFFIGSILMALEGRSVLSGVLAGLAILSKQNGILLIPLIFLALVTAKSVLADRRKLAFKFVLGLFSILAIGLLWDVIRQPAASSWLATLEVNNPGRLARSTELLPRGEAWLRWLVYIVASPRTRITASIAVAGLVLAVNSRHARRSWVTSVLTMFCLTYLAANWLIAFPILDRYLLPLVPIICLLLGRGIEAIRHGLRSILRWRFANQVATLLTTFIMCDTLLAGNQAAESGIPVGGDHGANDGIDDFAHYAGQLPLGSVIYSHQQDWIIRAYTYDSYVYPVYVDTPRQLERDLRVFGKAGPTRILVLSISEPTREYTRAARNSGFQFEPAFYGLGRSGEVTMIAYRIQPIEPALLPIVALDVN